MYTGDEPQERGRILIIDDEAGVREGCRRVLVADQYCADVAEDAACGLQMLQDSDYDVVFVDLKMPQMDGLEFLARAQELGLETVCVVITAYATLSTAVDATKRGAFDFVPKPFTPDELLAVTHKAMTHARLMRERNRLYDDRARRLLELTTEKSRLRSVVEGMTDGVIVTNREGELVLYNAAAAALVKCRFEPGGSQPLPSCIDLPALLDLISSAVEAGGPERITAEIAVGPEAHNVIVASVSPVTDEVGESLGVVTVLHDVSELKKVEQVKAQFVNMVAHELRAPLAAVDSQIMAIAHGAVRDLQKQRQLLERGHLRLRALLDLVDDLLVISRADTGTAAREIRPVQLAQVAEETCNLMRATADERAVSLTLDLGDEMPLWEGDEREATAILTNLVSNAIKYNRPGGTVTVRLRSDGSEAILEVSDNGVGISEEGQRRIFDEFFREKTDATREAVGTGLGLAIVQRLVRNYHGSIQVRSQLGVGSTFTVRLPLAQSGGPMGTPAA